MSTYEEDLLNDLKSKMGENFNSITIIDDSSIYFREINKLYPFCGSKINWQKVPDAREIYLSKENYINDAIQFIQKITEDYKIEGQALIISDNAFDIAISVSVPNLPNVMSSVLEIPQHHYILDKNLQWCFAFTMEGYCSFGFTPRNSAIN